MTDKNTFPHDPTKEQLPHCLKRQNNPAARTVMLERFKLGEAIRSLLEDWGIEPKRLTYSNIWRLFRRPANAPHCESAITPEMRKDLDDLRIEGNRAYHGAEAEHISDDQAQRYEARVADAITKIQRTSGVSMMRNCTSSKMSSDLMSPPLLFWARHR